MRRLVNFMQNIAMPNWLAPMLLVLILGVSIASYRFGVDVERGRNAVNENAKLAQLGEKLLTLQNQKHDLESLRVKEMKNITLKYEERLKDVEVNASNALAAVRAGALKLRIPTQVHAADSHRASGTVGASITLDHAKADAELSDAAAEFFISEASRADQVVEQLNACQTQVDSDRKH